MSGVIKAQVLPKTKRVIILAYIDKIDHYKVTIMTARGMIDLRKTFYGQQTAEAFFNERLAAETV